MLDSTRLRSELAHIHRTLSAVTASPQGKGLVDELRREVDGTTAAVLWQALFADCLRVAYTAAAADGVIRDDEITALYEFVFSVARHYAGSLSSYREFSAIDEESIHQFLICYANDGGPFGERATRHWPGLTLCRRAAERGDSEALERYERLMSWLIPAACEIGGVTEADPRWSSRVAELHGLRRTLAITAAAGKAAVDLRLKVFLGSNDVFAGVQHGVSVFESDPFDVEKIHHEARTSFEHMIERAIDPEQHGGRGRMLLVLGESGSGKTHLLRGFRRHVQEYGRGFVAYAQMNTAADNYARYLLHHVVASLSKPYTGPSGQQTGLRELASGLSRIVDEPLRSQILRLSEGEWDERYPNLQVCVNDLVDELVRNRELAKLNTDLLRVLLYALYPHEGTTARAYRYLLCEDMNAHDRQWIGDVVPRIHSEHPIQMICDLARLAFVTRNAALVLMIDQAELTGYDTASSSSVFKRAIDTLSSIVSEVPSAVAVIACLSDLYDKVRMDFTKAMLDRLEKDPPLERLQLNRSYPEIEAIVGRRLAWLYAQAGVAYRPDEPVYPIPPAALRNQVNRRTRDVLQWCQQFQLRCAAARKIVEHDPSGPDLRSEVVPGGQSVDADLNQIAAAWNDACYATGIEVPDSADAILVTVTAAARACADELGLSIVIQASKGRTQHLQLNGPVERAELAIAVVNQRPQGGAFGTQLESLRRAARGATPVAVRTIEFPRGKASDEAVSNLLKVGGRRSYIDPATLRTLAVFRSFQPAFPAERLAAWRKRDRPISSLAPMIELFDLERLCAAPPNHAAGDPQADKAARAATPPGGTPVAAPIGATARGMSSPDRDPAETEAIGERADDGSSANGKRTGAGKRGLVKPARDGDPGLNGHGGAMSSRLHVGTAATFGAEERTIEVSSLLRHTGILGSSGSGKTTLALNLIEQVLERDVAVVLVDRKGDLAGYAKPEWWRGTADPERARRLAERMDVRLFTPGTRGGRPLALSVVPDLQQIPEHERDRMLQYASNALAAMMSFGSGATDSACRAILTQAIAVLAERKQVCGLPELLDLLESRDDQLLARAGRYDDKLFKRLVQDLETVRLTDAELFDGAAEALTAETLIGRGPDGKVPLAIVSTRFLGEVERIQSWVAHLIACLNRYAARSPSAELRAVFMIDEADVFMPAGASKPPSKEPLQDLLKRARAAGLGIVLASQSPADFDYRSREQINTWFLGRIADQRSIDKMKPLFEHKPAVGGKLGTQDAGRFVMLQDGGAVDLGRTPSLLRTEQLPETVLMTLAARPRA
jgi:hypothetical protein